MRRILTAGLPRGSIRCLEAAIRDGTQSVRARIRLHHLSSLREVLDALNRNSTAAAVVNPFRSDPIHLGRSETVPPGLALLRQDHPGLPIIVYAPLPPSHELAFKLGALGIDRLWLKDIDADPRRLRAELQGAIDEGLRGEFLKLLPPAAPPTLRALVLQIVERAQEVPSVEDVSRWAFTTRSNLWKRFHRAGMGSPSLWIRYARAYRALAYIEANGCTIERAALRFGYGTGADFSRTCRRLARSSDRP